VHTLVIAPLRSESPPQKRSGRFTSETIDNDLDTFIDYIAMVN